MTKTSKIRLGQTKRKGRGVFATKKIKKGEVIECAPVLVIPEAEWKLIKKTILYHYVFTWSDEPEDIALALGFGSFYNHSYTPNANFDTKVEEDVIEFVAARDIAPDEEITINYNGAGDNSPLWFEVKS